ncbi:MAG TPA: C39 family peptidase, partial [Moraxellaceae bacterium]
MSDMVVDVEGTGAVAGELPQQLYEQGLYHRAWQAAEAAWGPLEQWTSCADPLLGSRILAQVGLFRSSAALVLRLWRRTAQPDGDLQHAYVLARLNLNGPYIARREWLRLSATGMEGEARSWWQALGSIIHGCFRDWERAQACLDDARREGMAPSRFDIEQSWLWEQQDRYEEALTLLQDTQPENGNQERLCLQGRARLLELVGQREQAMALLAAGLERFESVEIGMRLHYMQRSDGLLDAAEQTLARVRAWLPARGSALNHDVAIAAAEVLYRRGDMDAALEALSGARGYFFRQVRASLAEFRHSGVHRQLDVPFIRQHHMTCAPATLTALWRYHGHDIDHLTLAEAICYDGTSDLAERRWIEEQGWALREFELNLDDIRRLIDAGCPVGLSTVEPGSAHMQAVIGYDTRKGIYLLRDPYYPGIQEMLIEGAHDAYAASGPRCIVAVPPERRDWLHALPLRHAALYDDYFRLQQALERNDRAAAEQAAQSLEQQAPGHRLALWARRSLARYDDDSLRVLECTEALLQLFPQDLNLLVSKAHLLGELGRESEHLQFLEDTCRGSQNHPFLLRALATQMAKDGRRHVQTRRVLHSILKRQPMNDSAWWSLAGLLWDEQAREEAFECYRLCLCLQDKVEDYAIAYFKAARFLRRGEDALAYLRRRIEWLGSRSANPYISYMQALDLLDRTPEALAVIEQALQRHGDDAWLVAEAFDYFCNSGNPERARELLQQKGPLLAEVLRCYKEIRLLQMEGDLVGQLDTYQRILALQPRSENAAANVARLLADRDSADAAIAFLDGKLAEKPQNLWLLKEKLRYVQRLPID